LSRRTKRKNIGRKSKTAKKQALHRLRKTAFTIVNNEEISQCITNTLSSNLQTLSNVNTNILLNQEIPEINIDTRREKLFKQFYLTIWFFADIACDICRKLYYKKQICTTKISAISADIFPRELCELNEIITCFRCANLIKKGKVPTQAYWNAMFLDEIPDVIKNLTDMEQRLLSRIVPFVKIIKLGGRFGQSGFKGQAILFAQDIEEISEQLPLPVVKTGIIIVCEQLENIEQCRQFQINVQNLSAALSTSFVNEVNSK